MSLDATPEHPPPLGLGGLWRVGAGALCFGGFTLLAAFGTLILLPVALVLPGDRPRRVRRLASLGFRILLVFIQALALGRIRIEGEAFLEQAAGCLVIANHPSFVDIIVLFARLPEANCIMKHALRRHPLFAPFVCAGGYLSNSSDPLETITACRRAKENGEAIIIFPEGSRTRPDATPRLRRGAAQIALRAGMEILPVTIRCAPPVLTHGRPWFYMPPRRVDYVVSFHAPRPPGTFANLEGLPASLAARRLTQALQDWFTRQAEAAQPMSNNTPTVPLPPATADTPLHASRSRS